MLTAVSIFLSYLTFQILDVTLFGERPLLTNQSTQSANQPKLLVIALEEGKHGLFYL